MKKTEQVQPTMGSYIRKQKQNILGHKKDNQYSLLFPSSITKQKTISYEKNITISIASLS